MKNHRSSEKKIGALSGLSMLLGMSALMASACAVDVAPTSDENVEQTGMSWDEFRAMVYQEPDTGFFIVNGDELIESERELKAFYEQNFQDGALIVHTVGGVDAKWTDAQKTNLSYCIGPTFTAAEKTLVVNAMATATAQWRTASNNSIQYVYASAQDPTCTSANNSVVFDVNKVSGQPFLARAFFPNNSRSARNVLINTTAFGSISPWTLAGILRHELGHTLGFRHEHTRPEAAACFEDNNWRALTTYDSASVMHYPQCNGTQLGDLVLTAKDTSGIQALYPIGCAHDKCAIGTALNAASCGSIVQAICAADSYCCNTAWDSICVAENRTIGNSLKCEESNGTCAHNVCTAGAKLTSDCDAAKADCVEKICAVDSYCCNTFWDSLCVGEVASVCGKNCN